MAAYQEKLTASGRPVLTQFEVLCEVQTKVWVTVFADSAETAWQHAKQSKRRKKIVSARPTWIDTAENAAKTDELKLEHVGDCNGCRRPVFEHDDRHPDWPWGYTSDPNESEHSGKILCYPCAKERGVE